MLLRVLLAHRRQQSSLHRRQLIQWDYARCSARVFNTSLFVSFHPRFNLLFRYEEIVLPSDFEIDRLMKFPPLLQFCQFLHRASLQVFLTIRGLNIIPICKHSPICVRIISKCSPKCLSLVSILLCPLNSQGPLKSSRAQTKLRPKPFSQKNLELYQFELKLFVKRLSKTALAKGRQAHSRPLGFLLVRVLDIYLSTSR